MSTVFDVLSEFHEIDLDVLSWDRDIAHGFLLSTPIPGLRSINRSLDQTTRKIIHSTEEFFRSKPLITAGEKRLLLQNFTSLLIRIDETGGSEGKKVYDMIRRIMELEPLNIPQIGTARIFTSAEKSFTLKLESYLMKMLESRQQQIPGLRRAEDEIVALMPSVVAMAPSQLPPWELHLALLNALIHVDDKARERAIEQMRPAFLHLVTTASLTKPAWGFQTEIMLQKLCEGFNHLPPDHPNIKTFINFLRHHLFQCFHNLNYGLNYHDRQKAGQKAHDKLLLKNILILVNLDAFKNLLKHLEDKDRHPFLADLCCYTSNFMTESTSETRQTWQALIDIAKQYPSPKELMQYLTLTIVPHFAADLCIQEPDLTPIILLNNCPDAFERCQDEVSRQRFISGSRDPFFREFLEAFLAHPNREKAFESLCEAIFKAIDIGRNASKPLDEIKPIAVFKFPYKNRKESFLSSLEAVQPPLSEIEKQILVKWVSREQT